MPIRDEDGHRAMQAAGKAWKAIKTSGAKTWREWTEVIGPGLVKARAEAQSISNASCGKGYNAAMGALLEEYGFGNALEISGSSRGITQLAQVQRRCAPFAPRGITPLHHYYGAVRPSPAHRYFRPRGWSRLCFSLGLTQPIPAEDAGERLRRRLPLVGDRRKGLFALGGQKR